MVNSDKFQVIILQFTTVLKKSSRKHILEQKNFYLITNRFYLQR